MRSMEMVMNQLIAEKYLETTPSPDTWLETEKATPWYISLGVGVSAWLASLFIMIFVIWGVVIVDSAIGYIGLGILLCGLTAGLRHLFPRSTFVGQAALAFSLAGQLLFIYGVIEGTEDVTSVVLATILFELLLIILYPDFIQRLISTLIATGALWGLVALEWELPYASQTLVVLLMGSGLLIWLNEFRLITRQVEMVFRPVGYGLIIAMYSLLILLTIPDISSEMYGLFSLSNNWSLVTLILIGLLLSLEWLIIKRSQFNLSPLTQATIFGSSLLLLIPAWHIPGIVAALIFILLGFWRGNPLLWGASLGFLGLFVIVFYYYLDLTLLQKSLLLITTGLIFLGTRWGLLR